MRDPVPGHWRRAIVSVALTMLLGAVLFLLAANYHRDSGAYNSDNLLCTDFCDDVLCGRSLSGWHLPGAPYLFPDMLLLLPIHALAPDLFVEFAAYAIVFHLLLAATVAFVAIGLGLGRWEAILSGVGGVLFMATAHLGPAYAYRGLLLVYPGSHCSAVLVGLFLLGLTLASLRRGLGLGTGALFVLVGSLGTLSDRLLIVQFLAPLGLALFLLAIGRRLAVRQFLLHVSVLALVVLLAEAYRAALARAGLALLPLEGNLALPRRVDWLAFASQLHECVAGQSLLLLLLPVHVLIGGVVLVMRSRPAAPSGEVGTAALALFALLVPACNLLAVLLNRQAHGPALARYTLACWLAPFLLGTLLLHQLPGRVARSGFVLAIAGAALFALVRIVNLLPQVDGSDLRPPYPAAAQELDRLVRTRGPMRGLAGFWSARRLRYLTHEHVTLLPVHIDVSPFLHACNASRFFESEPSGALPRFDFVVVSRGGDQPTPEPAIFEACFGSPAKKVHAGDDEIWLYPRLTCPALDSFLRAGLARRLDRADGVTTPEGPCAKAVMSLGPGEDIEVKFQRPVDGNTLDVAVGALDCCRVEFRRGTQSLASTDLPTVPWASLGYGSAGLEDRLMPVSLRAKEGGWDRLVIRNMGPKPARLGQVFVLASALPAPVTEWPRPSRLRFEAEAPQPLPPGASRIIEDAQASGGKARAGPTGPLLWSVPLHLPAGRFALSCIARANASAPEGPIASLEAYRDDGLDVLASRPLHGVELEGHGFVRRDVTFCLARPETVRLAVLALGKTELVLDCVELTTVDESAPLAR